MRGEQHVSMLTHRVAPLICFNHVLGEVFWGRQHRMHVKRLNAKRPSTSLGLDKEVRGRHVPSAPDEKEILLCWWCSQRRITVVSKLGPVCARGKVTVRSASRSVWSEEVLAGGQCDLVIWSVAFFGEDHGRP